MKTQNIGDESADRKTEQGFIPGPWATETIEDRNQVIVYAPWSDSVRPVDAATFGDYRGAWIAKLDYNNGVPTKAQAESNSRLIAAAPALYTALENIYGDLYLLSLGEINIHQVYSGSFKDALAALVLARNESAKRPISDRPDDGQASLK